MEISSPILIVLTLIFIVIVLIIFRRKKDSYKTGSKIANTKFVKKSSYYKQLVLKYKVFGIVIIVTISLVLVVCSVLSARLQSVSSEDKKIYNRDIILCMDASGSMIDTNLQLVDNIKTLVNGLHGDRFGIIVFNSVAVTLSPLTTDHNYINRLLDKAKKSLTLQKRVDNGELIYTKEDVYLLQWFYLAAQTDVGKGYSLIPNNLYSCGRYFNDKDKDRTRLVILSTDNELGDYAQPEFTLEVAASYLREHNIKLYGIDNKNNSKPQNSLEYKNAVEKAGGKYYDVNSGIEEIIKDIDSLTRTEMVTTNREYKHDNPNTIFIILLFAVVLLFVLSKLVNL